MQRDRNLKCLLASYEKLTWCISINRDRCCHAFHEDNASRHTGQGKLLQSVKAARMIYLHRDKLITNLSLDLRRREGHSRAWVGIDDEIRIDPLELGNVGAIVEQACTGCRVLRFGDRDQQDIGVGRKVAVTLYLTGEMPEDATTMPHTVTVVPVKVPPKQGSADRVMSEQDAGELGDELEAKGFSAIMDEYKKRSDTEADGVGSSE